MIPVTSDAAKGNKYRPNATYILLYVYCVTNLPVDSCLQSNVKSRLNLFRIYAIICTVVDRWRGQKSTPTLKKQCTYDIIIPFAI